jgi:ABC-type transport system involved in multi-copper enzyme maturation permease subunit
VIGNVAAVFLFEWKRAMTWTRKAWWLVLAAFPAFIAGLVRFTVPESPVSGDDLWRTLCIWLLFALCPMLVAMLGTLLWTSPAISAELERRSWVYLAVRPNGATAVLLGKYLAAVTWVIPTALVGLTIAVPLCKTGDGLRVWWTMARLIVLSCPAYGAVFLMLGVIWPRRSLVLAVAYTLIFELIISFIPAIINKFSIQYRLRALAATWCEIKIPKGAASGVLMLIGDEPAWQHIVILLGMTFAFLIASMLVLRASEFSSSFETDA